MKSIRADMRYLFLVVSSFIYLPLFSCSCGAGYFYYPLPDFLVQENIDKFASDDESIIFHGTVVESSVELVDGDKMMRYKYKIKRIYTGEVSEEVIIYTPNSSDRCGYYDEIGKESIITAIRVKGRYETWREDCIRNVSKGREPAKFDRWLRFLNAVHGSVDGRYSFDQVPALIGYNLKMPSAPIIPAISFSIRNGQLHGAVKLYRSDGSLYAAGNYRRGQKQGWWDYPISGMTGNSYLFSGLRRLRYKNGKLVREELTRSLQHIE